MQVQKKNRYKLNEANAWKYIKTLSFDASTQLTGLLQHTETESCK